MKNKTEHTADINIAKLKILGTKKIFFGHQSVGVNIIGGLEGFLIQKHIEGFTIIETREMNGLESDSYWAHAKIVANRYPDKKVDDFRDIIEKQDSGSLDIAFF